MDRGAWWAAVHGVVKSRARLSNFTFIFMTPVKEKGKCISGNNQLLKKKNAKFASRRTLSSWEEEGFPEPGGLEGCVVNTGQPPTICSHLPLCCWETLPF